MDREVVLAGMSFTKNDRRLYGEFDLRLLTMTLIQQRCQKEQLQDDLERQLSCYEVDQEQIWRHNNNDSCLLVVLHLFDAGYVYLMYETALRWLQLARRHQGDLCRHGFSQSSAHMAVSACLVQFHEKELMLRSHADTLGIPTARYRQMYS